MDNFNAIHAAYNYLMQIQVGSMVSVCYTVEAVYVLYNSVCSTIFRDRSIGLPMSRYFKMN